MGRWRQNVFCGTAVLAFCLPATVFAAPPPNFAQITIPRISSAPALEDFLEMKPSASWDGKLAKIDQFVQRIPSDGEPVSQRTEAYLGYDDKNLYAIFICFDNEPHNIRARLSRREDVFDDDTVELMLDTFHDHRRAYAFFSNAWGVQADALWTEGQDFDMSFDTVFDTEARITPQGFVVKMSIPFRSLRFASNDPQTWGILLNRNILRNNESSFWPQYSSRVSGRLNQEGGRYGPGKHFSRTQFSAHPVRNFPLLPGSGSARPRSSQVHSARRLWADRSGCQSGCERQVRARRDRESRFQPDRVRRSSGNGKPALRSPVSGEASVLSGEFQLFPDARFLCCSRAASSIRSGVCV